jgi:hypothetical protein
MITKRTIIIFNAMYEPIGECSVDGGICSSVRLNECGEKTIGRSIERLSTQKLQRMMPFTEVLREWADHSGLLLISFPSERIGVWQKIASMSLSHADQYAIAFAISHASRHQQEVWQEALGQVCRSGPYVRESVGL